MFFFWSLPVAIPLILAVPTSVLLSRVSLGQWMKRRKLLLIPEERATIEVLRDSTEFRSETNTDTALRPVERAILSPDANRLHGYLARDHRAAVRRKTLDASVRRCLSEGPDALSSLDLSQLMQDRNALAQLHYRAWRASPDSYWGQCIKRLAHASDS
ncbi:hypothetical protein [Marinobacter santoriniensis]|uniref:hypothetical protein n=1 Tax=Marinobacter santoriniensis TaxID=523742 RepID=UPI0003448AB4|nr:hypothetical protein [Marinobacter santoriniensis]